MFIFKKKNQKTGMTYVEIIVVLSIFSVLSGVVIYNYRTFQEKIDTKNLTNEVALKIVEAQKSSLSGFIPTQTPSDPQKWKPAYGVYFTLAAKNGNTNFIYFTDLNNSKSFDGSLACTDQECLEKILITKNNTISSLEAVYVGEDAKNTQLDDLTITFSRPSSSANIISSTPFDPKYTLSHIQIILTSPNLVNSTIKVFPSGRIQID